MKLAVLFSGGKDSTLAAYKAQQKGHTLACLVSVISKNEESYMFHTPSIKQTAVQAEAMRMPLIQQITEGEKERELEDLKCALKKAKEKYGAQGVVSGAVESTYQASRVQRICIELDLTCFNPLWQKDQNELLEELLKEKFDVIIVGVFAYPLDETHLGRTIDERFIREMKELQKKYEINPAGEGGEYESLVLSCPLFKRKLRVKEYKDTGEKHSWRREVHLE